MWNKRRNWLLWLKLRVRPRIRWGFPLLLPVLEETLEEIQEFLSLWKPFLKGGRPSVGTALALPQFGLELIRDARKVGPCTLVQVQTEEVIVEVRLI